MNVSDAISVVRITDVGMLREHNEDAVASDLSMGLMLLADGMGGYKAGEIASEIAVLLIAAELNNAMQNTTQLFKTEPDLLAESNMLINAVEFTNAAIYNVSLNQPKCAGMGTTLVAGIFTNNKLVLGHIGDSRMYRLREGELTQLTEDHSLVQEQINAGLITPEQAKLAKHKNLVTRALGVGAAVELELQELDVMVGDMYMMCSDGLSDLLHDEDIAKILLETQGGLTKIANKLVKTANQYGGLDNISVVIAKIEKSFETKKSWARKFVKSQQSK